AAPLAGVGVGVVIYNLIFNLIARHLAKIKREVRVFQSFANLQIAVDWVALIFLVHYTGGVESPLIFYFVLHIVVSAILLSRRSCFLQVGFASVLLTVSAIIEYENLLPHVPSPLFIGTFYNHLPSILSYLCFLITGFLITAYLASTITLKLRERERQLVDLESNLEKAYRELEDASRDKSKFIAMISHELKSPVATIESILSRLFESAGGGLTLKQREYLERINRRARHILTLVDDLINLTREERVSVRKISVDLKKILAEVCESLQTEIEQKRIRFLKEMDPSDLFIKGDPEELNLLLSNLITNAVKYTPPGGMVQVIMKRENKKIRIDVKDTGIGIPEEVKEKIFEEFFRAPNAREMVPEGTGLGLPIIKRIVKDYKGEIRVESRVGKGTQFTCYLLERI
ncbi:HAMP domain-containing histidine kinase, partial [Candidatus Aerophobetes bacterium]|nr:HAMP domain-containing histidine kinase [Candidatus Aerophobetes bacterium]